MNFREIYASLPPAHYIGQKHTVRYHELGYNNVNLLRPSFEEKYIDVKNELKSIDFIVIPMGKGRLDWTIYEEEKIVSYRKFFKYMQWYDFMVHHHGISRPAILDGDEIMLLFGLYHFQLHELVIDWNCSGGYRKIKDTHLLRRDLKKEEFGIIRRASHEYEIIQNGRVLESIWTNSSMPVVDRGWTSIRFETKLDIPI